MELKNRDGLARICKFRGVETPALMPVVNPNLIIISPQEMYDRFGVEALITNSYIIRKTKKLREIALKEGLHRMLNFPGLIMTDSGTFQQHVYGDVEVTNREIVEFQRDIGSDIGTILDIFTEPYQGEEEVRRAIDETVRRGREAMKFKGEMLLAGVLQGSVFPNLREYSARIMNDIEFDYYPIGGVVPLMESYRYTDVVRAIIHAKMHLNPSKPVHLFGAGHPIFFPLAVLLGIDFFDSAAYIKYARDDRVLFPDGTRHLKDILYIPYFSPVFDRYDLNEIRSMPKGERARVLAEHNLYVSVEEIRRIKEMIREGRLWEYVEIKARMHPRLLEAYREVLKYYKFLEQYENISKKSAFFYTGPESMKRPIVYRLKYRLHRFPKRKSVIEVPRPWSLHLNSIPRDVAVKMPFGKIPLELEDIYPVAQSEFPRVEKESLWEINEILTQEEFDIRKIRTIADYQFGKGAGITLFHGEIKLIKSKNTGKIRNIIVDGEHVASLRAEDGFFSLRLPGAKKLHKGFKYPKLRVVVSSDSAEFNRAGKNVFAKFVLNADKNLRPGDEVLVVTEDDILIAVGRTLMNRFEMLNFTRGMCVKVREGISSKSL